MHINNRSASHRTERVPDGASPNPGSHQGAKRKHEPEDDRPPPSQSHVPPTDARPGASPSLRRFEFKDGVFHIPPKDPHIDDRLVRRFVDLRRFGADTLADALNTCWELANAVGSPQLFNGLIQSLPCVDVLRTGQVRLLLPPNESIGKEPQWGVQTPIAQPKAVVDLFRLLVTAGQPAAKHGAPLLMCALSAGLAAAPDETVRRQIFEAIRACPDDAAGPRRSVHWLRMLCDDLSQTQTVSPSDRAIGETLLTQWLQTWKGDLQRCIEPSRVIDELRRVLVARANEPDDTLVSLIVAVFDGSRLRGVSEGAEWAVRALRQRQEPTASGWLGLCVGHMSIPQDKLSPFKHLLKEDRTRLKLPLKVDASSDLLQLLRTAPLLLRAGLLLQFANAQAEKRAAAHEPGPVAKDDPAAIVPQSFFYPLALLLLREAHGLQWSPSPPPGDVRVLVEVGFMYLARSASLAEDLQEAMRASVDLLGRLPGGAGAFLECQLICLEALGRWQSGKVLLTAGEVLQLLQAVDLSGKAGTPAPVAQMQVRQTLHRLYDVVAAMRESNMPQMLEHIVRLHKNLFDSGDFNQEHTKAARLRQQLERQNWQPQSLDDLQALKDFIGTPDEYGRVIVPLLQQTDQLMTREARVQAATILCRQAVRTAWSLLAPPGELDRLGQACASLLWRDDSVPSWKADDLFAHTALVLRSALMPIGLTREKWEEIGTCLLQEFKAGDCEVSDGALLQLLEVHTTTGVRKPRFKDAFVRLYVHHPESRPALQNVLDAIPDHKWVIEVMEDCHRTDRKIRQALQSQALVDEARAELLKHKLSYTMRDRSRGLPGPEGLCTTGQYDGALHRKPLERIAAVTSHEEECWRILAFLAYRHPETKDFITAAGWPAFKVEYASRLSIRFRDRDRYRSNYAGPFLENLREYLVRHFAPKDDNTILLEGKVLEVDANQINAYELRQCIKLFLDCLNVLQTSGGQPEWLVGPVPDHPFPFHRYLPSLADAPAWLANPQGVVQMLLNLDVEATPSKLEDFFWRNFEWLPARDAAKAFAAIPDGRLTVAENLSRGELLIEAQLAAGSTDLAWMNSSRLSLVWEESKVDKIARAPIAALRPTQLHARLLLLRGALNRLGTTGSHAATISLALQALAPGLSASTDEAVHDYLDSACSVGLQHPEDIPPILQAMPPPRTCHELLRRCELSWQGLDARSWRSVTWSLGSVDESNKDMRLKWGDRPVMFRMPFHRAFIAKHGHVGEMPLIIEYARHLDPSGVAEVCKAVWDPLLPTREEIPGLPAPGLPPLASLFFKVDVRRAFEWTTEMAERLRGNFPETAAKLLNQVPLDARDIRSGSKSLASRVQGGAVKASPTADLPVLLVKDVLRPALQVPRSPIGLRVDTATGEVEPADDSTQSVKYVALLRACVHQLQGVERFGEKTAFTMRCLEDLEAAAGLLQQFQSIAPSDVLDRILRPGWAPVLQLIGKGRVGWRMDHRNPPDLCGVRGRWHLPPPLNAEEAPWIHAFAKALLQSGEPAGMSLLHTLVSQQNFDKGLCATIVDDAFALWDTDPVAAQNAGDGGWAGLLIALEHIGHRHAGTATLRTRLLMNWHDRKTMPDVVALALLSSRLMAGETGPDTRLYLETLFERTRGLPEADRIADWIMRRLHDDPDEAARETERRLRTNKASPILDDTKKLADEVLRRLGIHDPLASERTDDVAPKLMDPREARTCVDLMHLSASSASNPVDGARTLLRARHVREQYEKQSKDRAFQHNEEIAAAAFAKMALALPGSNPGSRQLIYLWSRDHEFRPDIAHALLEKLAQARPLEIDWGHEWTRVAALASSAMESMVPSYLPSQQSQVVQYVTDTLGRACENQIWGHDVSKAISEALELCERWRRSCPSWCRTLLTKAKALVQQAQPDADMPDYVMSPEYWMQVIEKREQGM